MENATITRRGPGSTFARPHWPALRSRLLSIPSLALIALSIAVFVGFLVYPTYPNYDSYYSLIWGREVLHGIKPSFEAYRAPTEHPLAILFGLVLSLIGEHADRVMVFCTFASFVVLAAGMYRLGKVAFGPVVGMIAAVLMCTRFDFPFLAARAYIDIPYLALIVWAAALEAEKPRRGTPVLVLLALGATMRPEAWLLIGLYDNPTRLKYLALTAIGPLAWVATDFIVTGQPLFSLTHTNGLAEDLGRTKSLADVPAATLHFLKNLDKLPVFWAGMVGVVLGVVMAPKRAFMVIALLVIGVATFFMVGIAGLSIIDRYLLVPSLMIMILAALTLGGWSLLGKGKLRTGWMGVAVAIVAVGVVYTVTHVNFHTFQAELVFRGDAHHALQKSLRSPELQAARRCGPVSEPNHKFLPDTRWILGVDAKVNDVIARSDPTQVARARKGGVAMLTTNRSSLLRQALVDDTDTVQNLVPPAGFSGPIAESGFYSAYVKCP
jgi:hypothetical protein